MKYLAAVLMLVSVTASADCFTDGYGQMKCFANPQSNDFRNDSNSVKLYDSQGQYRGNLNGNQYDPNSINNPYGRYGSKYSTDSVNNPYNTFNRGW